MAAGCQPEGLVSRNAGWRDAWAANAASGPKGVTSKYGLTTSLSCRRQDRRTGSASSMQSTPVPVLLPSTNRPQVTTSSARIDSAHQGW